VCLAYPLGDEGHLLDPALDAQGNARPSRIKSPEDAASSGPRRRARTTLVARETHFRGLLPGTWFVIAEGFVQAGEAGGRLDALRGARGASRAAAWSAWSSTSSRAPVRSRCASRDRRPVDGALLARRGAPA
jgi:hypothetical protein